MNVYAWLKLIWNNFSEGVSISLTIFLYYVTIILFPVTIRVFHILDRVCVQCFRIRIYKCRIRLSRRLSVVTWNWSAGQQDATHTTDAARVGSLETNIIWYFRQRKQKTGLINIIKRIIVISLQRSFKPTTWQMLTLNIFRTGFTNSSYSIKGARDIINNAERL